MGKINAARKKAILTSDFVAFIPKDDCCYVVMPRQLLQDAYHKIIKFLHEPPESRIFNGKFGFLKFNDYELGLESAASIGENLKIPFRPHEQLKFLPGYMLGL